MMFTDAFMKLKLEHMKLKRFEELDIKVNDTYSIFETVVTIKEVTDDFIRITDGTSEMLWPHDVATPVSINDFTKYFTKIDKVF